MRPGPWGPVLIRKTKFLESARLVRKWFPHLWESPKQGDASKSRISDNFPRMGPKIKKSLEIAIFLWMHAGPSADQTLQF